MNRQIRASLITCGTELLRGKILNTNASYFAKALCRCGLEVKEIVSVGDDREDLKAAITRLLSQVDFILLSGGLGSTEDDLTMEVAADIAGFELAENARAKEHLHHFFATRNKPLPQIVFSQTVLPIGEGSQIIPNENGTAFGAILSFSQKTEMKHLVLLPGPPIENQAMFQVHVEPFIHQLPGIGQKEYATVRCCGIGEGLVVDLLADLFVQFDNPYVATYCSPDEVLLEFTQDLAKPARTWDGKQLAPGIDVLDSYLDVVKFRLKPYVYEVGERNLPTVLRDLLRSQGKTLAVAESCTGGLLSQKLVSVPGISVVYRGGFVTYQNEVKESVLGIAHEILKNDGEVSAVCAQEMALATRSKLDVDYSLAITGFAGPKYNADDPVGLVYIACAHHAGVNCQEYHFNGSRDNIREWAAKSAMTLLFHCLQSAENN